MEKSAQKIKRISIASSLFAVIVGIGAKLSLTTGDLLPGIDGAYYWVQVRSVLNNFTLAFSDLPLIFWIQAGIAKVIGNIPLAVRISDAVLPAISAIPIYLIAKKYRKPFLPAIGILIVLLHPVQLFFFTGDFIKNEATIPAVFFMALVLVNWEKKSKRFSILSLLGLTLLIAISHFGTILLAFSLVGMWSLLQLRKSGAKFWIRGVAASLLAFAALLVTLAILVPSRYERLVNFLTTPSVIFENPEYDRILNGSSLSVMTVAIILGQISTLILAGITWRSRSKFTFSDLSLVISSLLTTFIFSSPFIGMEWSDRLTGLSIVSLSIAAIIIFGTVDVLWQKLVVGVLAAVTLFSALPLSKLEMKQVFSDQEYSDFKDLAAHVEISSNSVIVARHGVEYLSAWEFSRDVVLETYYESADLRSYDSVYYIEEVGKGDPGMGGGGSQPTKPPTGSKPPTGMAPSGTSGKGGVPPSMPNKVSITGETIYSNGSFAFIKVR